MTASSSKYRHSLITRLKRSRTQLFVPGIIGAIGCVLLASFGPIKLECWQVQPQQSQCNIHRSAVFGLVKRSNLQINQVQRAELKIQQQVLREIDSDKTVSRETREIYGVLIVGDTTVLFDGYTPNQRWHEQEVITPVNNWLLNGGQKPLILKFRNVWLNLLTVSVLAIATIWTYRVLYP